MSRAAWALLVLTIVTWSQANAQGTWPPGTTSYYSVSGCGGDPGTFATFAEANEHFFALWNGVNCATVAPSCHSNWTESMVASGNTWRHYSNGCVGGGYIQSKINCASGGSVNWSNPSSPVCNNTVCATNADKTFDFDNFYPGTAIASSAFTEFCQEGCYARPVQYACDTIELVASGYTATTCKGTAVLYNQPCVTGLRAGTRSGQFRASISQPTTQGQPSTGVTGGPGQADGEAANLARIATNTDRIARTIASGGSGTGGGSGTTDAVNAVGTKLEQLGGSGGAPDTEASRGDLAAKMATAQVATSAAQDLEALRLGTDNLPTFGGTDSRWNLGFGSFLGASATCDHTWVVNLPIIGPQNFRLNVCAWAPYVRAFLYWAVAIWTAFTLWELIYDRGGKRAA